MRATYLLSVLFFAGCTTGQPTAASTESPTLDAVCPIAERPVESGPPTPDVDVQSKIPREHQTVLFKNARLIDGRGGEPIESIHVLVQGDRIAEIGKDLTAPAGARVFDLQGRTLLPGFIDAHVHITMDPTEDYPASVEREVREIEADVVLRGARNARATLAAGFTTVRNVGGSLADRALRDAIAAGLVAGPRMLVANHSIGITGGHCDPTAGYGPHVFAGVSDFRTGVADGPDQVRQAVRYQIKHGADVIKICATGGVLSQADAVGAPQMSPAELRAAVDEANRAERKVAAHAHGNQGIREAIEAGVHSIEHGSILDAETTRLMKQKGTVLVPTTYVAKYVVQRAEEGSLSAASAAKAREIAPKMRQSFQLALDAGVVIALGSDAGVFQHGLNGKEFTTMVELGMKPMDAIVAGTRTAARLLGLSDIGTVEAGKIADLVVVDGDPLQDVTALERPILVVKSGAVAVNALETP